MQLPIDCSREGCTVPICEAKRSLPLQQDLMAHTLHGEVVTANAVRFRDVLHTVYTTTIKCKLVYVLLHMKCTVIYSIRAESAFADWLWCIVTLKFQSILPTIGNGVKQACSHMSDMPG